MSNNMLAITVTSGRPKAFDALQKYSTKPQSLEAWDWLIVSDDSEEYRFPKGKNIHVVKRDPSGDKLPSINENWLAVLDWIEAHPDYDSFIVLEDDDWYNENYLRETREHLKSADLVGWQEDAYYYPLQRWSRRVHNVGWASLAATAFKRSVLPYLRECVSKGDIFIDLLLWKGIRQSIWMPQAPLKSVDGKEYDAPPIEVSKVISEFHGTKRLMHNFTGVVYGSGELPDFDFSRGFIRNEHPRHVGIKGNWHGGKGGLSARGHNHANGGGPDYACTLLQSWVGEAAMKFYKSFTHDQDGPANGKRYPAGIIVNIPLEV